MSDWMTKSLRDLLDATFAGEWGDNPYPYNARVLRATDINDDMQVNLEGGALRLIPKLKLEAKKLIAGDIILEGSGGSIEKPVGRVAYFDVITSTKDDFIVSNFFRTVRPNKEVVHPKFLYWLLNWFYKQPALRAMQQQTTGIINLKLQQYLDTLYCLPTCKNEQIKIAEILDTIDLQIRQTEIIIAKLKQVKQGLLHDLLTRGVDENGALRPSYQDAPELYKPSELGWIPTDWEITDLDDALSCIDAGKSPSCPNEPASSGAWGVLKVSAVHPNGFKENENKVVESKYLQNPAYEVKNGDLLITRANTPELVGLPCLVETSRNRLMLSDKTLRLSIKDGINKAFIFFTLYQPWVRKQIEVLATGTSMSMKNISQKSLRSLRIKLPKESEQNEIYLRVKQISDSLRFESDQLNKLKLQKSGLMDDLLTGKKRVTNLLNKQPNS